MYVQNLPAMEPQLPPSLPRFSTLGYVHRSHHGEGDPGEISKEPSHAESCVSGSTGEPRGEGEMRCVTLDSNLASMCDHIHMEGFNNGVFSDVILNAKDSTYRLHRLIISRSSYFRNMLVGPWREANSPVLTLHVDDKNVDGEAIEIALAYLYGNYPKLNNDNAFRVLAAASFLDLQDLCAICTDFITSKLCPSNFITYQVFAESQDYGVHGERVRNACWAYLCQSGFQELKEVLPKLSPQTLLALLTSDELWVPCEEQRFELALYTLLAKGVYSVADHSEQGRSIANDVAGGHSESMEVEIQYLAKGSTNSMLETKQGHPKATEEAEGLTTNNVVIKDGNTIPDYSGVAEDVQVSYCESSLDSGYISNIDQASADTTCFGNKFTSNSHSNAQIVHQIIRSSGSALLSEGPSADDPRNHSKNTLSPGDQLHSSSPTPNPNLVMPCVWERSNMPTPIWGGRTVSKREPKPSLNRQCDMSTEYYDAFVNIFEGGSLLYCNMSFEALLNIKRRLEELGFPGKAVDAGLWLKMLLSQRVQDIGELTCKNCCLVSTACTCRQPFGYSRGVTALNSSYVQDHDLINLSNDIANVYITNPAQGERNGLFRPARVHPRGSADGLAGIGRGATYVPTATWPPTRYVFSRVPFGIGNRNNQQHLANDNPENRAENQGGLGEGGLTALVGLNQGFSGFINVHTGQSFDTTSPSTVAASLRHGPMNSGIPDEVVDSNEKIAGTEWENMGSSISLDLKTPLNHFPPFRFGAEFPDVDRLTDGVVKHSPEFFYGGSLWKISVQAFSDEDPQGRRTLGVFLHRRKADISDQHGQVPAYTDAREKVTARYQLICPSKREVMVFGSYKQTGTLLPKAPKGWGWRTALLFNEFGDRLQNGALRVAAVVQLI